MVVGVRVLLGEVHGLAGGATGDLLGSKIEAQLKSFALRQAVVTHHQDDLGGQAPRVLRPAEAGEPRQSGTSTRAA
jgi:hypothetical protein